MKRVLQWVPELPYDIVIGLPVLTKMPEYKQFKEKMEETKKERAIEQVTTLVVSEEKKVEQDVRQEVERLLEEKTAHLEQETKK